MKFRKKEKNEWVCILDSNIIFLNKKVMRDYWKAFVFWESLHFRLSFPVLFLTDEVTFLYIGILFTKILYPIIISQFHIDFIFQFLIDFSILIFQFHIIFHFIFQFHIKLLFNFSVPHYYFFSSTLFFLVPHYYFLVPH